jgi:hypothetical protein
MRQVEVSRTLVFDAPRHARGFFEALVVDNLDRACQMVCVRGVAVETGVTGSGHAGEEHRDDH